jgi:hypothetical protein
MLAGVAFMYPMVRAITYQRHAGLIKTVTLGSAGLLLLTVVTNLYDQRGNYKSL